MRTEIQLVLDAPRAELILAPPPGRPPVLDHDVLDAIDERLAALERAGDAIRMLIVRSAAPRYFCLGADIAALRELDAESIGEWIEHGHRVFNRIENLPVPVLARIEGYAVGGGLELALAADLILATPEAQFAQPETRLGFVPGWGGTRRLLERVGAARAKELMFTGRVVPAAEAVDLGLVDFCGSAETIDTRCAQLLQDVVAGSPIAIREVKQIIRQLSGDVIARGLAAETRASAECLRAPDTRQRVQAFLARRQRPAVSAGNNVDRR